MWPKLFTDILIERASLGTAAEELAGPPLSRADCD